MSLLGITCLRDDGPYCVEWVAHHLAAGFDHMLVLTHDCSDGSDTLLDELAKTGRLTHLRFKPEGRKSVQWQALELAWAQELTQRADWVMVLDCDEFICLQADLAGIPSALEHVQGVGGEADAIAVPWRFFGSCGHPGKAQGLTPERFLQAAPQDLKFPMGHLFKTFLRPRAFRKLGVHRPRQKKKVLPVWLGPSGETLPQGFAANEKAISLMGCYTPPPLMQLNHYSLRSADEFMVKRRRGLPNHMGKKIDLGYWAERNWNSVRCDLIAHMMEATQRMFDELMGFGRVAELHQASEAAHEKMLGEIMQDIENVRFHWQLGLLEASRPPTDQAMRTYLARRQAAMVGR